MLKAKPFLMEFHVARQARDLYQFDETFFSFSGNVVFANFHAARVFAQKMNARRDLVMFPEQAVKAGQINAMALIDEILHLVLEEYRKNVNPLVVQQALTFLEERFSKTDIDLALKQFASEFPSLDVYKGNVKLNEFLDGQSSRPDGSLVQNRQLVLEEMLMLWLANVNPAFSPFLELFDDQNLEKQTQYTRLIDSLNDFFEEQPHYGPAQQNLVQLLRSPAIHNPYSLTGQLEFMRNRWGGMLGTILYRVLSSLDLVKEEEKPVFAFGGPGPSYIVEFTGQEKESEKFSPDRDWMPNLVLMAKNSYVWLDQLSKKYQRPITQLDQVPDEELELMSSWGITGLWLIGLWERSMASKRVKQLRGNPEAVASAYSLFSYDIAADLGGDQAYQNLRQRAWKVGIRLASDMVPNHMGIDSRWVIEHPDWFVSLDYSPFPSYTFNGPNLSWDSRVGIYLEDHYYSNSDAAVVFKRVDFWSGSEKFIYHGNDGTSMPWNDTAQLNYLIPHVREALIQTILHVARKFPIIRFDAAMTLAKRHYQRLWFPEPGSGGDIPSRAEHGLTKAQFDEVFPQEFWREVVDRVAQEVPDTLLLAEAFWLMEGYFVRTLGMHRVYNSAFMNMLRDEKNLEYRRVIKNTLEFEPEILKRYVNFMNNPDERTAVEQFGKGDKYFGICAMMATMPGLPMLGHGQIEGFTEKYGMEYRRAYWEETPDYDLIERHKREIFPLLRRRYLFAEVEYYLLYDFNTLEGYVNEDVYAYSNRVGSEKALFVYHNKFATAHGWIRNSTGYLVKTGPGPDDRTLIYQSLGDGLDVHNEPGYYTIFRDHFTGLEYIRNSQELYQQGMYLELGAYNCHVFMDFREVVETPDAQYGQLALYLKGGGVPNVDEALKELLLQTIHTPFLELVNPGMFNWLIEHRQSKSVETRYALTLDLALDETETKALKLLQEIDQLQGTQGKPTEVASQIREYVRAVLELPESGKRLASSKKGAGTRVVSYLMNGPDGISPLETGDIKTWSGLLSWVVLGNLGKIADEKLYAEQSRAWMDELLLGKLTMSTLHQLGLSRETASSQLDLLRVLVGQGDWYTNCRLVKASYRLLNHWLKDSDVQRYLQVHRYQGVLWFNKEAFETLLWWLFAVAVISIQWLTQAPLKVDQRMAGDDAEEVQNPKEAISSEPDVLACFEVIQDLLRAMDRSEYKVEKLLEASSQE